MTSASPAPRWHALLKGALLILLASNTAVYGIVGTLSEALDSVAWLTVLVSFELETGRGELFRGRSGKIALRGARMLAAAALVVAATGYVRGGEWLDATNVGLWIGVVALLELEVRRPAAVIRHRRGFVAVTTVLYSGLVGLVLAWLLRGEWFAAYDATLWLMAFATLEMDVLIRFRTIGPAA